MAPEIMKGSTKTLESDVYSFAMVCIEVSDFFDLTMEIM